MLCCVVLCCMGEVDLVDIEGTTGGEIDMSVKSIFRVQSRACRVGGREGG